MSDRSGEVTERLANAQPQHRCCFCKEVIISKMYGAGDGSGQRFACPECYWRECERHWRTESEAIRQLLLECVRSVHTHDPHGCQGCSHIHGLEFQERLERFVRGYGPNAVHSVIDAAKKHVEDLTLGSASTLKKALLDAGYYVEVDRG